MSEQPVVIKSAEVFRVLMENKYHSLLTTIAMEIVCFIQQLGITVTITSAYREGDKGVHGFFRGLDFRSWEFTDKQLIEICEAINKKWEYDPERPDKVVLIHHDVGRGPHLHLQTHPNTANRR